MLNKKPKDFDGFLTGQDMSIELLAGSLSSCLAKRTRGIWFFPVLSVPSWPTLNFSTIDRTLIVDHLAVIGQRAGRTQFDLGAKLGNCLEVLSQGLS